ncbi:MAG: ABC transporter ATP-binding protein [Gemmataceae bacterium]
MPDILTAPLILARGVHKAFGVDRQRIKVLEGAGLGIAQGEVVFLVGPSGSGKSTLLSILGCLLSPDAGSVRLFGEEVSALSPRERAAFRRERLGFIFQTFNLLPNLSALDNVALCLVLRGVSHRAAQQRALGLLDQVGLSERVHLRPPLLSTGECQRVAIARGLSNQPAIVFADEPTASLDAANGQAIMLLLTRLVKEQGMTLVVVTHDNRIEAFADRILHLEKGRLIRSSRPPRQRLRA